MSGLEIGKAYKNGYGNDVNILFLDAKRGYYVGYHGGGCYAAYRDNGRSIGTTDPNLNLIIPPQLPWEWVVGDWYKCRNGDVAICETVSTAVLWLKVYGGQVINAYCSDGRLSSSGEGQFDIIAHLGPIPQGVYHVSDGDTQLLQDLKRWQERGGKIEAKANGGGWVFHQDNHPLGTLTSHLIYRAHGYTGDREFPKPAKPDQLDRVVTIRDMLAWGKSCERAETFFGQLAESQP